MSGNKLVSTAMSHKEESTKRNQDRDNRKLRASYSTISILYYLKRVDFITMRSSFNLITGEVYRL